MPDERPDPIKIDGVKGSQFLNSGKSCYDIKNLYNYKRSGWYWIKTACMPVARRMFCDMVTLKDFMYIGETDKNLNKFDKNSNIMEVRKECNAMGLEPL